MRDLAIQRIPMRPWRSDSLSEQLADLHAVALRLGMREAAEWLTRSRTRHVIQQPPEKQ